MSIYDQMGLAMITTPELLERIGCKTSRTLARWSDLGLIPRPRMRLHPSGHGRMGFFEQGVLDRCLEVRRRLDEGQRLEDIAKMLPPLSAATGRHTPCPRRDAKRAAENDRKWRFARAAEALADVVTNKIMTFLRQAGIQRPGIGGRLYDEMRTPDFARRVLATAKETGNPVIVLVHDRIEVVTDKCLAATFMAMGDEGAFCAVPIPKELCLKLHTIDKEAVEAVGHRHALRIVRKKK